MEKCGRLTFLGARAGMTPFIHSLGEIGQLKTRKSRAPLRLINRDTPNREVGTDSNIELFPF